VPDHCQQRGDAGHGQTYYSDGRPEYAKLGTPNNTGTRIVSVSGHVRKPGYYEVEVGKATLGELIFHENFGGGLREGRKLKAVIPGGSSAKVFKAGEKFKMKRKGAGRPARPRSRWTCWMCLTISIRCNKPAACPVRARSL
jgi:hypothetical protein